jgi:hypothetical protein
MRLRLQYDRSVTARLLGRDEQVISSTLSSTESRIRRYRDSEAYKIDRAYWETEGATLSRQTDIQKLTVERFAKPMIPRLTAEELKPLGLAVEDFERNYVASWILPGMGAREESTNWELLLLLTRRHQWDLMQDYTRSSSRLRKLDDWARLQPDLWEEERAKMAAMAEFGIWIDHEYFTRPEEYLIAVTVDHGDIVLTPQGTLALHPQSLETLAYWNIDIPKAWLSIHSAGRSSKITNPIPEIWTGCWTYNDLTTLPAHLAQYQVDQQALLTQWLAGWGCDRLPLISGGELDTGETGPHLPVVIDDL